MSVIILTPAEPALYWWVTPGRRAVSAAVGEDLTSDLESVDTHRLRLLVQTNPRHRPDTTGQQQWYGVSH